MLTKIGLDQQIDFSLVSLVKPQSRIVQAFRQIELSCDLSRSLITVSI
ncbi:hypothetical protein ATHL_00859 [Anaerolinea thermolimosa]|nr:hypothetical protein [Anaerolinea thermolimosa]GAP06013.1 hypothetical protein ATHL_00859 [Anaerolinea thermolimosa]